MECQESEYLDEHRKCVPCRECGPGLELSKECGYGEGRDALCSACPPRRFKDSWGHHGCKPCVSCLLINRVQKSNCTATSNGDCGECLPGFYRKTRIGGLQDLECIPCTKQTPSSEPQCSSRTALVPSQNATFLALTSSVPVIIVLVLLALAIIFGKRFWKSQCQRVFLKTHNFSAQRVMFQASAMPSRFPCDEQMSSPCCLGVENLSPCSRQAEGPVEPVQFISDGEAIGLHIPALQPNAQVIAVSSSPKFQLARSILETQPLIRNSESSDCSAGGCSSSDARHDPAGFTEAPTPLSSCASEMQPKWPHAPVECTELDLQRFSTQVEFPGTKTQEDVEKQAAQRHTDELTLEVPVSGAPEITQSELVLQAARGSLSSFQNPVAESGEQAVSSSHLVPLCVRTTATMGLAQGEGIAERLRAQTLLPLNRFRPRTGW
ncbi:tumor necrosis factor receptor superfamily member 27 [Pelodiscus sinensis]|uniref:Ectodysplasin A2 receptor n=1 Tax=Pelodiscus sinensis TaxID=13735 RepID=K7FTZ1_PELSI|nr:tumor necrosis factor receptor superfamily member 27 isoform X1 [Pelodiscus sinensis]XP_006125305.1 tumor necrosis factor receptor superfamily member 27 isoform X1 [Pelodiscus sinensis]|eukprot:XP_006125304.1 tumor necrosis factor receptor superfamily member 27 isoform X1 [Pelodiscus sinensis]